ncbi:DUF2164 domain-containing protein [Paenibacillus pini]|uniref:DUF2164 domain-containing protein n=1 Tax=Paenibacillus pini JCM 16418 TaxID=1236976 RepID=W7YNZ4_9BACL|nr:DUF2164 domain-containing protein [Paenibacillus pini]GAF10147.1 hypothetical protein JCM16418_4324 [Paenibacillus pini JCM 16418]
MKTMKLPKEQQGQVIQLIQHYFKEEHGEDFGELAADGVMHFFMTQLAPYVYNQALDDCRHLVNRQMGSLEDDIYALEQKVKLSR